jgi:hypothetical protein
MVTVKIGTDSVSHFGSSKQASRFGDGALGVHPVWLNWIQLGALAGQVAGHDAHALALLLDLAIVRAEPGAHLLTDVPGGVVPDKQQGLLAQCRQFLTAPGQVLRGELTHGAILDKAQPDLFVQDRRPSHFDVEPTSRAVRPSAPPG